MQGRCFILLRYTFVFLIAPILFSVAVYTLLRGLLFIHYPEYFADLSTAHIIESFIHGLRFDFSISTLFYGLFLLGLIVSSWFKQGKASRKALLWGAFLALAVSWSCYLGSIAFFGHVYRHLGSELLFMGQDTGFFIDLLFSDWILWFIGGTLALLFTAWLWQKLIIKPGSSIDGQLNLKEKLTFTLITLVVALLFGRGFILTSKPISIIDAYILDSEKQAALALNGTFSALHSMRRAAKNNINGCQYFDQTTLQEIMSQQSFSAHYRTIPTYIDRPETPPNIVIILLESWSSSYIDGLAGSDYGATPFMDSLINKSAVWSNAYAAGQRSIEGIQAILTSIPLIEGQPVIGWGLEQNRITTLADEANILGYNTVFMQTSKRRSFHVDAIAGALGFQDYFGMEDFPELREYPGEESTFGWDYEGLMFLANYLNAPEHLSKPSLAFFFTGTTHEPFPDPGEEFHIYPHNNDNANRYLNTLRYSDWALEQFMTKMKEHPEYDNTIFIFMADHVLRASANKPRDSFHIPLIIYSPDNIIPVQKTDSTASQYDLLPTIASLIGIQNPIATFGRSLLTEHDIQPQGALSKQGRHYVWFDKGTSTLFNAINNHAQQVVAAERYISSKTSDSIKAKLQTSSSDIKNNSWIPETPLN